MDIDDKDDDDADGDDSNYDEATRPGPATTRMTSTARPRVAHRHVLQKVRDFRSTLGHYYRFVQDMEVLPMAELDIAHLWSLPRVLGWIRFLGQRGSGSTKRNKALRLIKVLKWVQYEYPPVAMHPTQQLQVNLCLTHLRAFSEKGKKQYKRSLGKALNEEALIETGACLHPDERPVFILWLLDRIETTSQPFQPPTDQPSRDAELWPPATLSKVRVVTQRPQATIN